MDPLAAVDVSANPRKRIRFGVSLDPLAPWSPGGDCGCAPARGPATEPGCGGCSGESGAGPQASWAGPYLGDWDWDTGWQTEGADPGIPGVQRIPWSAGGVESGRVPWFPGPTVPIPNNPFGNYVVEGHQLPDRCPHPDDPCLYDYLPGIPPDPPVADWDQNHFVLYPSDRTRAADDLILLLHGKGGDVSRIEDVARAFASACFRVIVLRYDSGGMSATEKCEFNLGVDPVQEIYPGGQAWNDCLEAERDRMLTDETVGIETQLVNLLQRLRTEYPFNLWGNYLAYTREGARPNWSKIITAGWSEGGSQAAWIHKVHAEVPGAIFISGGGDRRHARKAPNDNDPAARWMEPGSPASSRVVGLFHANERTAKVLPTGMELNGVPIVLSERDITQFLPRGGDPNSTGPFYTTFGNAPLLVRRDNQFDDDAHISTVAPDIPAAHMYLACRAGGKVTQ